MNLTDRLRDFISYWRDTDVPRSSLAVVEQAIKEIERLSKHLEDKCNSCKYGPYIYPICDGCCYFYDSKWESKVYGYFYDNNWEPKV